MSEGSGFSTSLPGSGAQLAKELSAAKDISAKIQDLPRSLEHIKKPERLQAEVIGRNKDGSTRLQTPKGPVDVKFPRGTEPPAGKNIEIEVAAGRPPRTITVKADIPVDAKPQIQNQAPNQAQVPGAPTSKPAPQPQPARPAPTPQTPLPTNVQTNPQTPPPANPLPLNQVIRLLPLPLAQAVQVLQQTVVTRTNAAPNIQTLLPALTQQLSTPSGTIQTQIPQALTTPALNTLTAPSTPQIINLLQTSFTPITTTPSAVQPQNITLINSTGIQNSPTLNLTNLISALSAQSKTPAQPLTSQTLITPTTADTVEFLDVKIVRLQSNPVSLLQPGQTQTNASNTLTPTSQTNIFFSQNTAQPSSPLLLPGAPAGTQTAQILGFTDGKLPIIQTQTLGQTSSPQFFTLQFQATNVRTGDQISFLPPTTKTLAPQPLQSLQGLQPLQTQGAVTSVPVTPAPSTLLQSGLLPNLFTPGNWATFDELYQTLLQTSPQVAQNIRGILPNATAINQLGSAALLFVAAMRSGDIGSWLGERAQDTLRRIGQMQAASRLGQELSNINRITSEPIAQDWRGNVLPFLWQEEIHKIVLYYKKHDDETAEQGQDKGQQTRFVMDMDLTRIGAVQIDGLVQGNRLDVMVRSINPFSQPMQQSMRALYQKSLGETNYYGDLNFQGDSNWVHVLQRQEIYGESA